MNIELIANDWREWWKNHRHSGFCYKKDPRTGNELYRWNTPPMIAFTILRYRVEFEHQTGISTGLSTEKYNWFTDEERAGWKKEQEEDDQFAREYGFTFDADKNKKIWDDNFPHAIAIMAEQLAAKHQVKKEDMPV